MMAFDSRRAAEDAARERAWRHQAILRIEELTSRVPVAVMQAGVHRAAQWKQAASKARALINRNAPPTTSLRTALALLEQFEC